MESGCSGTGTATGSEERRKQANQSINQERQTTMNLKNLKGGKNNKLGMAMTEYLIVLGIVALGCITAFGVLGQEVKVVMSKQVHALSGGSSEAATDVKVTSELTTMASFVNGK